MVRDLVIAPFDTQVEHEGRTGKALLLDPQVSPAAANMVGHHALHGLGKVGVDDDCIRSESPVSGAYGGALAAFKDHLFDRLVEQDPGSEIFCNPSHSPGDGAAAADGVKHPVLI